MSDKSAIERTDATWNPIVGCSDYILTAPLRWKRPRRISISDLFHEDAPDEWIDRVFAVMALAPQHTFLVLTKRAERMREYLTQRDRPPRSLKLAADMQDAREGSKPFSREWPLPNVVSGGADVKASEKHFDQMSLAELHRERAYWDARIRDAPGWGAAVKAASDFRDCCDAWIARREREARQQ